MIGATFCAADVAPRVARTIDYITRPHSANELKWQKVTRKAEPMYETIVRAYFQMVDQGYLHYYCLVVDNTKVNHKLYNDGDHELGFTKFVFTLLYKFARLYRSNNRFYCFLDHRTTKHDPADMKAALNSRVRRDLPRGYDPYRVVKFTHSEHSRLIQLTDIITGAIAYETNQHHAAINAAEHKIRIMRHVANCAGVVTLAAPTPNVGGKFNIWHLDFDAAARRRLRKRRQW